MKGMFFDSAMLRKCVLSPDEAEDFRNKSERRVFRDPVYGDGIAVYVRDGAILVDSIIDNAQARPREALGEATCSRD